MRVIIDTKTQEYTDGQGTLPLKRATGTIKRREILNFARVMGVSASAASLAQAPLMVGIAILNNSCYTSFFSTSLTFMCQLQLPTEHQLT